MSSIPETMRAVVMTEPGEPEVLQLREVPTTRAASSEVLVKVLAAGVNPIDAKTRSGVGAAPLIPAYPAILGGDISGVVAQVPYENFPLQPGDEVYGMLSVPRTPGGYAEYAAISSLSVAPKPAGLGHAEAAAVPLAGLTAWGSVQVAEIQPGQRVLIHAGAGGVGHFAVQFAARLGAHVITTASARNADWLRSLGAEQVVDYTRERFEEVIEPVDAVIDLIGNVKEDTGTRSLRAMKPGGILVNVPSASWPTLMADAAQAGMRATTYRVAPDAAQLCILTGMIERGELSVHVDRVLPLANAADAHRLIEAGHTRGKIVLDVALPR